MKVHALAQVAVADFFGLAPVVPPVCEGNTRCGVTYGVGIRVACDRSIFSCTCPNVDSRPLGGVRQCSRQNTLLRVFFYPPGGVAWIQIVAPTPVTTLLRHPTGILTLSTRRGIDRQAGTSALTRGLGIHPAVRYLHDR